MHDLPRESELKTARTQNRLGYVRDGCLVLLVLCWYLHWRGFPVTPIAWAVSLVLFGSILLHIIQILEDGFFARGKYVVRDKAGVAQAIVRLVVALVAGAIALWAIHI
jgi:hypothetical protein